MTYTNKIVIIGNGFDLAHNLETSYNNFLIWYLNQSVNQALNSIDKKYGDNLIKIDCNSAYIKDTFNIQSIDDFKSEITKMHYRYSIESEFFLILFQNLRNYNWVDIEFEYYNLLIEIHKEWNKQGITEKLKTEHFKRIENLNKSLALITIKLSEYLEKIDKKEISKNQFITRHIDSILQKAFNDKDRPNLTSSVCFLNFNYTSTINKYLTTYSKKEYNYNVINIHGSVNEFDSIIFGYGDLIDSYYERLEETNNKEFLIHIKQFHYLQRDNYHSLIKFIENSENNITRSGIEVHIMGHSCGVTDRILLNKIFNPKICKKIQIYYHKINNLEDDFFEKTQNITRNMNKEHKMKMEIINNKLDSKPLNCAK